ncbi:MAG TPA: NF038122 family metalloprotease [Tepidisphaeraceae bacterium]
MSDANDEGGNDAIVNFLPTGNRQDAINPLTFALPTGFTQDPTQVSFNKANAKALGFSGLDEQFGAADATITFNSSFAFDFDNRDGVTPGQTDFETVATHEIGHALGFVSDVDFVDTFAPTSTNPIGVVLPTTLDLFRFDNVGLGTDPLTPAEFQLFARSLVPGNDEIFDDITNEFRMSTGRLKGDGRQGSHWKDDAITGMYIGIMDPTLAPGVAFPITQADLRAFDLIGYEIVPEPTLLAAIGLLALTTLRRRRVTTICD